MIGRRAFAAGCLGSLALARGASGQPPRSWTLRPIEHPAFNWRMVAQSDLILRGILAASALKPGDMGTVALPLAVSRLYKGGARPDTIDLRYDRQAGCGPAPEALTALNARDAVFFLGIETGAAHRLVGCSADSATAFSSAHERALQKEIGIQAMLIRRVSALLAEHPPPFEESVTAMIRAALTGDNQSALRGLLRSGRAAAPAMIRHLGDRRPLPKNAVIATVDDRSGQYPLGEVADLLMLALGIVAKDAELGWPAPDMSGEARQRIVDAWRVWLGYSLGLEAHG
jgi:hypothetical protein